MTNIAVFSQVNLIVSDMDASVAFYRLLGLEINAPAGDWPPGSGARHSGAQSTANAQVDFDNAAMTAIWGDAELSPGATVIGFSLESSDAVDAKFAELIAGGYRGRREPYDAFFGARYAIVDDPDGRAVGLMSPVDPTRKFVPTG